MPRANKTFLPLLAIVALLPLLLIALGLWQSTRVPDMAAKREAIEQQEEVFRILKKEGFNIESSELAQGKAIRKLSLLMLETIIKLFNADSL